MLQVNGAIHKISSLQNRGIGLNNSLGKISEKKYKKKILVNISY